jgi:hypothetical protein
MDVKSTLLNGDLQEYVYMAQPKDFVVEARSVWDANLINPFMD